MCSETQCITKRNFVAFVRLNFNRVQIIDPTDAQSITMINDQYNYKEKQNEGGNNENFSMKFKELIHIMIASKKLHKILKSLKRCSQLCLTGCNSLSCVQECFYQIYLLLFPLPNLAKRHVQPYVCGIV